MSYADGLVLLTEKYLAPNRPYTIAPLTRALGCRHVELGAIAWSGPLPTQPAFKDEALVRSTLLLALRSHMCEVVYRPPEDGFAILDGLARRGRWRDCLLTTDDTYLLGALLAYMTVDNLAGCASVFCSVANDWLKPSTLWLDYPSTHSMMRALFGGVWPSMALDEDISRQWAIRAIILKARPPFVLGLAPAQDAKVAIALPGLEIAS